METQDHSQAAFPVRRSVAAAVPPGATYQHTFARDGFYHVGCDIHSAMSATIIATTTPYATLADASGAFVLDDVPSGAYTITVYAGDEFPDGERFEAVYRDRDHATR